MLDDSRRDLDAHFELDYPWTASQSNVHSSCTDSSDVQKPAVYKVGSSRRSVKFNDEVQIIAFCKGNVAEAKASLGWVHRWLRTFWCLEGQGSTWTGIKRAFECVGSSQVPWIWSASRDEADHSPCRVQASHQTANNPITLGRNSNAGAASSDRDAFQRAVASAVQTATSFRRTSVATWFLARNRFHVGLVSRTLRVDPSWNQDDFQSACRSLWSDLLGEGSLSWHVVQPSPNEMPGVSCHVIIAEDLAAEQTVSLLHCDILPALRRYRAVIFTNGIVAHSLVREAQLTSVCIHGRFRCVLRVNHGSPITETQVVLVQVPTIISALIMEQEDDDGSESRSSESEDSECSTDCGSHSSVATNGSDEIDDQWLHVQDEVSFMSASLPYNALQPFIEGPVEAPQDPQLEVEVTNEQDDVVQLLASQIPAITSALEHVVSQAGPEPFRLVTYGLGLMHLGRRDAIIQSSSLDVLFQVIDDLWQDHAAAAPLHAFLVQHQPELQCNEPYLVFLVEVQYLPITHPMRRCPVLVQETGDEEMLEARTVYAAWVGRRITQTMVLVDLQRDEQVIPRGVRDVVMTSRGNHITRSGLHDLEDGDLVTLRFEPFPEEVTQVIGHVDNAVRLFTDIYRFLDTDANIAEQCFFHGISPANRPLGHRPLPLSVDEIRSGRWIHQARQLWPFGDRNCNLVYAAARHPESPTDRSGKVELHFIVNYHHFPEVVPVLVSQSIEAIEDGTVHEQTWTVNVPQQVHVDQLLEHLTHPVFWKFKECRTRVHSGWSAGRIVSGAAFELVTYTHRTENILAYLILDADGPDLALEHESISMLQLSATDRFEIEVFQEIMAAVSELDTVEHSSSVDCGATIAGINDRMLEPEDNVDLRRACLIENGDGIEDELLPDKELQLCLEACPNKKHTILRSKAPPVTLCLDAVIPNSQDCLVHDDLVSFQWFDRRNWYNFAISQSPVGLDPLPDGLRIKPVKQRLGCHTQHVHGLR